MDYRLVVGGSGHAGAPRSDNASARAPWASAVTSLSARCAFRPTQVQCRGCSCSAATRSRELRAVRGARLTQKLPRSTSAAAPRRTTSPASSRGGPVTAPAPTLIPYPVSAPLLVFAPDQPELRSPPYKTREGRRTRNFEVVEDVASPVQSRPAARLPRSQSRAALRNGTPLSVVTCPPRARCPPTFEGSQGLVEPTAFVGQGT
jgi:hypothetical protein